MREEEVGFQLSQRAWQGFLESVYEKKKKKESVYVLSNILSVASL